MGRTIWQEAARNRAEVLRAEGMQSLKVLETAEKGSQLYEVHAKRVTGLAPLVAMLDVHSRPPSGSERKPHN